MGTNILPGAELVAGTGNGQLNQYYGQADTTQTAVTGTSTTALSSVYTIPAGEASAGSAYQLDCGGGCDWGTASEGLQLAAYLNTTNLHDTIEISSSVFASGAGVVWKASLIIVCSDGVDSWYGAWSFTANQDANAIVPGTAADNTVTAGDAANAAVTASVSSAITVALQANWTGTTGTPGITNYFTTFRKIS